MFDDKHADVEQDRSQIRARSSWAQALWVWGKALLMLCALCWTFSHLSFTTSSIVQIEGGRKAALCPQQPVYVLPNTTAAKIELPGAQKLAKLLSGAVQVDTSVGDDWPTVAQNPAKWSAVFDPFRQYLRQALPELHAPESPVTLELVNEHGLLYTWPGKNAQLKPIVFMAHQDVVPVEPETVSSWTYPPFSGFIDDKLGLVWGRGSSDTKTSLVSTLVALQSLLRAGFVPERTIVCSFGFDEESAGTEGGEKLAAFLVSRYGKNGASMLVDEGGEIMRADAPGLNLGIAVAAPAVAEKGYLDARITVHSPGGHSSEPKRHTSIGYLSQLITALEQHPYKPILDLDNNPALAFLQCTRDAPNANGKLTAALEKLEAFQLPSWFTHLPSIATWRRHGLGKAKQRVLDLLDDTQLFSFMTTQAVDLISGGVKVNALPEQATAVVNHRIDVGARVRDVRRHIHAVVKPIAARNKLAITGGEGWEFVSDSRKTHSVGEIVLSDAFHSALEPAPLTPLGDAAPWKLLQAVIRSVWSDILVAPDLMGGNTDTKSYWELTTNIFRFSPGSDLPFPIPGEGENIHTVNERTTIDGIVKATRFYALLMQAASLQDL